MGVVDDARGQALLYAAGGARKRGIYRIFIFRSLPEQPRRNAFRHTTHRLGQQGWLIGDHFLGSGFPVYQTSVRYRNQAIYLVKRKQPVLSRFVPIGPASRPGEPPIRPLKPPEPQSYGVLARHTHQDNMIVVLAISDDNLALGRPSAAAMPLASAIL
jgi:hypothetical protein